MQKEKKTINVRRINKMRWIAGMSMSAVLIVTTAVFLILNVTDFYKEGGDVSGMGTFRMFTTLSNIIGAVAAFMCLPFQIQGLRKDKYKLPSWIVILLFVGATGVFLSFFMAVTIISMTQGYDVIMLRNSNLFMHLINPILITVMFALVVSDTHVKFRFSFIALIPVLIYAFIYFLMVFALKKWEDHYQANTFIPWPLTLLIVIAVAFGIAELLRFLHNLTNKYVMGSIERYYLESSDYDCPRVSDAVGKLAKVEAKFYYEGDDIYIPTDIIALLSTRYKASSVPLDILYDIYLENYLDSIKKKENE